MEAGATPRRAGVERRTRVGGVVLAAGESVRFGGPKLLAPFLGRPLIQATLDAVAALGLAEVVLVVGRGAEAIRAAVSWRDERMVVNERPEDGLSGSLRIGVAALSPEVDAALVLLGDQPLVRRDVADALRAALRPPELPVAVPAYRGGGGANPVLIHRSAFRLVESAAGDRGLGPLLAARPDLVAHVPVQGDNPDIDTPAELSTVEARVAPALSRSPDASGESGGEQRAR